MKNAFSYIEDYLGGELKDDQLREFEKAMQSDAELRKAVQNFDVLKRAAEGMLEADILQRVQGVRERMQIDLGLSNESESTKDPSQDKSTETKSPDSDRPSRPPKNNTKWLWVIGVLAALVVIWLIYQSNSRSKQQEEVEQILMAYYERPDNNEVYRSDQDTVGMSPFSRAKYMFELNEFKESELILNGMLVSEQNDSLRSEVHYWLAHVYVNMEEWEKAEASLKVTNHPGKSKLLDLLGRID